MMRKEQELAARADQFVLDWDGLALKGFRWGGPPYAVALHGWGGRALQLGGLVEPLAEHGVGLLAVDHPAHGQSEGEICTALMVAGALERLVQRFSDVDFAVAHSFGSIGACIAMSRGFQPNKVAFIAPTSDVPSRFREFAEAVGYSPEEIEGFMDASDEFFGRGKLEAVSPWRLASGFDCPALLVHDRGDQDVAPSHSERIATHWRGSLLELTDGLGHYRIIRDRSVLRRVAAFLGEP